MPHTRRAVLTLAAAAALAACAPAPPRPAPPPNPEPRLSPFRAALRDLGIATPATGKAILVNIPSFEVLALEDGEPVLRSRAIVGTAADPTPEMETHVSVVRFRPRWRPTPEMVASGEYEDRVWPPGRRNPLGLAAIRLEPGLLIYLHDTNQPRLFEREMRALSHGCIRVERWDELVAWVLDWDLEEVHRAAEGSRTFDAPAPPIPVLVRYHRVFPDETGRPVRHPDPYDRDGAPPPARARG